jgi:acyl-[acyl-carrier-protein] desaturase
MDPVALLAELEPTVERTLDRHLASAKEWFPHQLVPWGRARDFGTDETWDAPVELDRAVRSSLLVNLLTEDNLPYYTSTITALYGDDGAWGAWVRRWTAEEGRHSIVLRDYVTVTRALDPVALERARMAQVECGHVPRPISPQHGLVYVTLQELATRVAHHNTGKRLDDPAGLEIMKRVAADENRHYLFYRELADAAFLIDPSTMLLAVEHEVRTFEMPGTGILDFSQHAKAIARAGIYDFRIHYEQILLPVVLRHWDLEALTGLTAEAERARDSVLHRIERIAQAGRRTAARREEHAAGDRSAAAHSGTSGPPSLTRVPA